MDKKSTSANQPPSCDQWILVWGRSLHVVPHESAFQDRITKVKVSELIYRKQCFKETGGKVLEGREASGWWTAMWPDCRDLCCPLLWIQVAPWLLCTLVCYPSTTWQQSCVLCFIRSLLCYCCHRRLLTFSDVYTAATSFAHFNVGQNLLKDLSSGFMWVLTGCWQCWHASPHLCCVLSQNSCQS